MSLITRINALATRVANEFNDIRINYVSQVGLDQANADLIADYMSGNQNGFGDGLVQLIGQQSEGQYIQWYKQRVLAATTTNITLSGTQTIDGVSVGAGYKVLVKNQTTASQNGIYTASTGTWSREYYSNLSSEISGAMVSVSAGTVNGGQTFTTAFKSTDTLGTTAMSWSRVTTDTDPVTNTQLPARLREVQTDLLTDLNSATASGWYVSDQNPSNAPAAGAYVWGLNVDAHFAGYIVQTATLLNGGSSFNQFRFRRIMTNNIWAAWFQIEDSLYVIQSSFAPIYHTHANHPEEWTKQEVRVAATSNVASLSGLLTIDGVTLVAGDRVLLTGQTSAAANGIYVAAAGAWARATDANTTSKITGAVVSVAEGTTAGGLVFRNGFKQGNTLGTTAMPWEVVLSAPFGGALPVAIGGTGATDAYGIRWNAGALGSASTLLPAISAGVWTDVPGLNALMDRNGFQISFREVSSGEGVQLAWRVNTSTNNLQVRTDIAISSNTIRAVVIGGGL